MTRDVDGRRTDGDPEIASPVGGQDAHGAAGSRPPTSQRDLVMASLLVRPEADDDIWVR
jgi:hypothetical protein